MVRAKITFKGQATIPKEIREHLEVSPGDHIDFVVLENGVVEIRPAYIDVKSLSGILSKEVKRRGVTIEAMNKAVKARFSKS